jgi:hypothetical protein
MLSCDWQFLHLNWTLEFWPPMGAATMTVYGQSIAVVIIHYSSQPVLVTQLTTASFDRLHAAACELNPMPHDTEKWHSGHAVVVDRSS